MPALHSAIPRALAAAFVLLLSGCGSSTGGSGGANSSGGGPASHEGGAGSGSVLCMSGGDPTRDYCYCGADVPSGGPNLVTSCSLSSLQHPMGACCALHDANNGCTCLGYICSYPSFADHSSCICQWGQALGQTTTTCTGTYCCESPATSVLGGQCQCSNTPCANGTKQVADCGNNPTPACEPGATSVSTCK